MAPDPSGFWFNDKEVPELLEGKYCGVGISKCFKTIEGIGGTPTLAVVVDLKKSALYYDRQPLIKKIAEIFCVKVKSLISKIEIELLNKLLKGLYVRCCYGKYRTFRLFEVMEQTPDERSFMYCGTTITLVEYFEKVYHITLNYPKMPVVVEKTYKKELNYYPIELLQVCENQRVTLVQQTTAQVRKMNKVCTVAPNRSREQTDKSRKFLRIDECGQKNDW